MHPDDSAMNADRTAAPLWQRIAQGLIARIAAGEFAPGTRLPSEVALAAQYGVNRHTLRNAVRTLSQQGYLTVRPGSGAYVRKRVLDYPISRRTRLSRNLAAAGDVAGRELVDVAERPAGDWAPLLGLRRDDRVEWMRTRASVRGRPLCLAESAFPSPRFRGIADRFATERSVSRALATFGVADFLRQRTVVGARLPTADEADWLERYPAAPVLTVEAINVAPDGAPVEASRTVFAADAIQFVVGSDAT